MIKCSDFIVSFIAESPNTANDVFMVSGGGVMHILDSLGKNECLNYVCTHHEQAASIAAEGYTRCTNKIGVAVVTSGPGGTNAITGVMGAWVDSIPILVISGQVKLETTILRCPNLRQLGDQEINITDLVRPITKYAVIVTDKRNIKYHLKKAVYLARSGRPGPVWIDVPLDIQGAMIDENKLREFDPIEIDEGFDKHLVKEKTDVLLSRIKNSKRPVIIVGNGVTLSDGKDNLINVVEKLNIPVLTSISGIDLIPSSSRLFLGRPGIIGERPANFIIQNADLLIAIGTRMNLRVIGYSYHTFAREAFKLAVDIDKYELEKPTLKLDLAIHSDAKFFLQTLYQRLTEENITPSNLDDWFNYCHKLKQKYPIVTEEHRKNKGYVSSYYFTEVLSEHLKDNAVIVTGNGTAYTSTYQAIKIKKGQRMFANVGCAAMGYGLPAAIGASFGKNRGEVICITGDGSIQMNLQELQTILNHKLPIKIFLFNNKGYLSIKTTQNTFFNGNYVGSTYESGVMLPDMTKIAQAYGYRTEKIHNHEELEKKIPEILNREGAIFCEVMLDPFEKLGPKAASEKKDDGTIISKPLEDLSPFLPRKEFYENMLIKPVEK